MDELCTFIKPTYPLRENFNSKVVCLKRSENYKFSFKRFVVGMVVLIIHSDTTWGVYLVQCSILAGRYLIKDVEISLARLLSYHSSLLQ